MRRDSGRRGGPWLRFTVALVIPVLVVSACGNDDGSGGADEGPTSTTTQAGSTTGSAITSSTTVTTLSTTSAPTSQTVLVYFGIGDPDVCEAVAPHQRVVPTTGDPVRAAFDGLVGGPTPTDVVAGAFSFFSGDTQAAVRSAAVENGLLVIDMADLRATLTPAGANTSCGSAALLGELNATAFQFAAVDRVRYEMEGSCDAFGEWLQRECIEITRAAWADEVAGLLPGEPYEGILTAGTVFGVIGVTADDQLNVRARPGADQVIIDSLDPLATGLVHTGRARKLEPPVAIWYEVAVDSVVGWVHSRFVAPQSGTFDITSEVVDVVGRTPTGTTIEEIGAVVIEARSRFADPKPTAIVVDGPTRGDLHEITYDLLGFGDDSVLGERLHLIAADGVQAGGPLELESVEVTYLCARGTGGGAGLCP